MKKFGKLTNPFLQKNIKSVYVCVIKARLKDSFSLPLHKYCAVKY